MPYKFNGNSYHYACKTADFSRKMQEGIKRAPEERAKAIKEFWGWLTRS